MAESDLTARERFETIYQQLRERICLLQYPPGSRLSEEALAEEFGVSRTPLRRVLGRLEAEGLLQSVHGVGTLVVDVDIDAMTQAYELRMELAEMIGRLSPAKVDATLITRFRELLQRCAELAENPSPSGFSRLQLDFFHTSMRLTESDALREASERLYYQTARIWIKSIPSMDLEDEINIFAREIADTLAAVELGDLVSVGHIRRSHISMSFHRKQR